MSEEELEKELEELEKELNEKTEEEWEAIEKQHREEDEKFEEAWEEEHKEEVDPSRDPDDLVEFSQDEANEIVNQNLDGFDDLFKEMNSGSNQGLGAVPAAALVAAGFLRKGHGVVKSLLAPVRTRLTKKEWQTRLLTLKGIFEGSAAMLTTQSFIFGGDDETKQMFEELREELRAMTEQINRVSKAVTAGFDDLNAHNDFRDFREQVMMKTERYFDRYLSCFNVLGDENIKLFVDFCEEAGNHPQDVLTDLRTFLSTRQNIFMTQLKAKDYAYSTYQEWWDIVNDQALKLLVVIHYYCGLKHDDKEYRENNLKDFTFKYLDIINRLDEIELERLKLFNEKGFAAIELKNAFERVKEDYPGNKDWSPDFLTTAVTKLKEEWEKTNGLQHFYLGTVRGSSNLDENSIARNFEFHMWDFTKIHEMLNFRGDPQQVAITPNVAYEVKDSHVKNDAVSLILIQPMTAEMLAAHKEACTQENINKIVELLNSKYTDIVSAAPKLETIKEDLIKIRAPLYIAFSTSVYNGQRPTSAKEVKNDPRKAAEGSTTPTEFLHSLKIEKHVKVRRYITKTFNIPLRILVEIVFAQKKEE